MCQTAPYCAAPHSPDWHSFKGTASSPRWPDPAAERGPRVPAHIPSPRCWWPVKEQLVQTYAELLVFWGENTTFSFRCFLAYSTENSVEYGAIRAMLISPSKKRHATATINFSKTVHYKPQQVQGDPCFSPGFSANRGIFVCKTLTLYYLFTGSSAAQRRRVWQTRAPKLGKSV